MKGFPTSSGPEASVFYVSVHGEAQATTAFSTQTRKSDTSLFAPLNAVHYAHNYNIYKALRVDTTVI